jgi:cytochrome b
MVNGMLRAYPVWDRGTRLFHWINFLSVLVLGTIGAFMFFKDALGVTNDGMVVLKTTHTIAGYVFTVNLLWRIAWGFIGNRYARWSAILPFGSGYVAALKDQLRGEGVYLGHSPVGRLSVTVLFLLLLIQMVTGLVIAGTDLFYPPFGGRIAAWVAAPGVDPATLLPYHPEMYDPEAWKAMRAFRSPFKITHEYSFYVLLALVVLHVAAVIIHDVRHRSGIISAMFTGQKVMSQVPVDRETP